jgi:hypothetical protein
MRPAQELSLHLAPAAVAQIPELNTIGGNLRVLFVALERIPL